MLRVLRVILRGTTSDTMRHYKVLRVVLGESKRYYEWYYGPLRGTTRKTLREVLQETKNRGKMYFYGYTVALQERLGITKRDSWLTVVEQVKA